MEIGLEYAEDITPWHLTVRSGTVTAAKEPPAICTRTAILQRHDISNAQFAQTGKSSLMHQL